MKPQDYNILIVDDEPDLLDILSFDFERMGYVVQTASGGDAAFQIFQNSNISLIITDIRMSQGDGLSLLKNVRAISNVPIICVSGFSQMSSIEILELGADAVFEKPFDRKKLHEAVTEILERYAA